ncbi:MAG: hypothetical protein AB8G05_15530 [Oligoflexales bacterium]
MQLPSTLKRKISILCISSFLWVDFCFASVGASDDLLIERATEAATRIAKGHKDSSELLAKLLARDVEVIFIMEKKGLQGGEIWNLYHTNFHDDLEAFVRGIRSVEKDDNS